MAALDGIEHVIVLMLENRSFDCMLGRLRPSGPDFAGIPDGASNPYQRCDGIVALPAWTSAALDPVVATIPDPDPGEDFADMNEQLFGPGQARVAARPSMSGFVANFVAQPATDTPRDPAAVMHGYTPQQLPVLSALANAFGVCDQWHAAAPCQTWPNRFFAHTGTALGHVNNRDFCIPFAAPNIFGRLVAVRSQLARLFPRRAAIDHARRRLVPRAPHYRYFGQFLADAQCGALPNYSFIEPRYFADLGLGIPNDQHPPHNVLPGEKLIADVYNAVRASPCGRRAC